MRALQVDNQRNDDDDLQHGDQPISHNCPRLPAPTIPLCVAVSVAVISAAATQLVPHRLAR
jgi:hypothetical protein